MDNALWTYLDGCYQRLEWFNGLPADVFKIAHAFLTRYDVLNIKAALLSLSNLKAPRLLPIGHISNQGQLDELAAAQEEEAVATVVGRCGLMAYVPIVREFETDGGARARLHTEAQLEAEYHRHLADVALKVKDGTVITRALGTAIDLKNLQVALRAMLGGMTAEAGEHIIDGGYIINRQMMGELLALRPNELPGRFERTQYHPIIEEILNDYDKNKNISVVDQVIEKHRYRLNREVLSPVVLSPIVAVWYLFIKETEMRNVRMILKAVLDSIPLEEIRDNLVVAS
jgi:vacuolar-type H+-ATPase subunit C/Vma6